MPPRSSHSRIGALVPRSWLTPSHGDTPRWHNRDFLLFWSSQTVSEVGSQVTRLALPLVALLVLDASTFDVAALSVVGLLPWLLIALPAGVYVDRFPRRPILVVTDWGRALVLISVPVGYLAGVLTLAQLYVVTFVAGTLWVVADVASQSYLPSLVAHHEIRPANAKLEVGRSGAQVAGPGLAGVLVSAFTAPYAILFDSATFAASALGLMRIRRVEPQPERPATQELSLRSEVAEGLRFVLRHPILRPYVAFIATANLFSSMLFAILLVFAVRELQLSAQTIGLILTVASLGSVVGALAAAPLARAFGIGRTLIGVSALSGFGFFLVPLASGARAIPFLVVANLLFSFYVVVIAVVAISLIQSITPNRLLGRTTASRRLVIWGVLPLGSLIGGVLGSTLGLRTTTWITAAGASAAVLVLLFSPIRRLRDTEDAYRIVHAVDPDLAPDR